MPENRFPDCVTHNFHPTHGPFRNLCALPRDEAARVFAAIGAAGLRRVKPDYLDRRLSTELWLFAERCRRFGRPHLAHPIYFFVGNFADGCDPGRPASIVLPLERLPAKAISFTIGDSMTSHDLATKPAHADVRRPYHGRLFSLAEIRAYVADHGLPADDGFIELQLWDERPLAGICMLHPGRLGPHALRPSTSSG